MINNLDAEGVGVKVSAETGGNAAVRAIYDHISRAPGSYGINAKAGGLEFTSTTQVKGFPNRCRLKVWQPETNILMAWFYKPSAVHFSRDRYSLGGVVWELDKVDLQSVGRDVDQWLAWLDSGLDPEKRPENWKSAFPYDIPD